MGKHRSGASPHMPFVVVSFFVSFVSFVAKKRAQGTPQQPASPPAP